MRAFCRQRSGGVLVASHTSQTTAPAQPWSVRMADSMLRRYAVAFTRWHYEDSLLIHAIEVVLTEGWRHARGHFVGKRYADGVGILLEYTDNLAVSSVYHRAHGVPSCLEDLQERQMSVEHFSPAFFPLQNADSFQLPQII